MAVVENLYEFFTPSRFITFSFPNPYHSQSSLRFAVLDSPIVTAAPLSVGVMFVPAGLETDWIFSTESGHFQLLFNSPGISRLILVGDQEPLNGEQSITVYNHPSEEDKASSWKRFVVSLQSHLLALLPNSCYENGIPNLLMVGYDDSAIRSEVLEKCIGSSVGEFLVENVEIKKESGIKFETREFRRRLRFKTGPCLVQTKIRIIPQDPNLNLDDGIEIQNIEFKPDIRNLVQFYLPPMAASLSLISTSIDEQLQTGHKPKALCIGVGGGAMLTFLATHLDFEVFGVEIDTEIVRVAKQYFGLVENEYLHISIGDGVEFLDHATKQRTQSSSSSSEYNVIMVDLGTADARKPTQAPPMEFVCRDFLMNAKSLLSEDGILVMNVIPSTKLFNEAMVDNVKSVFDDLFQIDIDNADNFVVIACVCSSNKDVIDKKMKKKKNSFLSRLELLLSESSYINSIKKI